MTNDDAHSSTRRLRYRSFSLRLEGDCGEDEARSVIDAIVETSGDRVGHTIERPGGGEAYVKAEFRRPDQPISKRMRAGRAVSEGRGYRRFLQAGLHVPQLLLFGEQPRMMPRGCAIVMTERAPGGNAYTRFLQDFSEEWPMRAVAALCTVHSAGLIHGDAALRNFIPSADGTTWIIDLPRYGKWSPEAVRKDLALLVGSTVKHGGEETLADDMLDAYTNTCERIDELGASWRADVVEQMETYVAHLRERDRTRAARHAKKRSSTLRPGERTGRLADEGSEQDAIDDG